MNVASLELSKELYELSEWEIYGNDVWIEPWWNWFNDKDGDYQCPVISNSKQGAKWKWGCPAYDLGYLLRKLPTTIVDMNLVVGAAYGTGTWWAWYEDFASSRSNYQQEADTPEDALVKLAIELFKQGILSRT